jgi:peptidyl-tRNA hydrolase, PTH1 family
MSAIKLIIGLANPGEQYSATRHNAGAWFVDLLAKDQGAKFRLETKAKCQVTKITQPKPTLLAIPNNYMNLSGLAVRAAMNFYKIQSNEVLVAHDEIDLPCGIARIKETGGHGGHNGLRDIIKHLGTNDFWRLRIGVDRPERSSQVENYVLKAPRKEEQTLIDDALCRAQHITEQLINGDFQSAMLKLHTQ